MAAPFVVHARARARPSARPGRPARDVRDGAAGAVPTGPAWLWSVALGAIAFAAYAWGAGTVAADKDSSEFTLVLATLGVAHPTGYPLYTLLGHLFGSALHAAGIGWPQAAALWSALGGAMTVGSVHAIAARLLSRAGVAGSRAALVALLPAIAFGANPVWTFEATVAEVNAWHVAWVTLAFGTTLAWEEGAPAAAVRGSRVATTGLLLGAGLAHHVSSLLWSAPLAASLLPRIARGGSRALATFVAAFLAIPVAGFAFLAWRVAHPGPVTWPFLASGLGPLLDHVTGAQYRHYLGRFAPSPTQAVLFTSYVVPLLLPALAALASFAFTARVAKGRGANPRLAGALLVAGALQALFAFSYGVPDPVSYFLPVIAVGLAVAPRAVLDRVPALRRHGVPAGLAAAILLLAVLPGWVAVGVQRRAMFDRFDALVRDMWTRIPDRPGFVVWADDMSHRLRQYQMLDGLGTSLEVVNPVFLAHPVERERFRRAHGFDPLAGRTLPPTDDARATGALADTVAHALNATSPLPVYLFAPQVPSVRQLLKSPAQ